MPLLVDGHNLIGRSPDLSLSDPQDEAKLIARLSHYAARSGKQVTVVFDPSPEAAPGALGVTREERGRLSVVYAPPGRKADDLIREIASHTRDRKGLVVVTSDHALASFVRQCGVRVQAAESFIEQMRAAQLGEKPSEKPQASAADVALWSQVFQEPPEKPAPPSPPRPDLVELKRKRRMEALKQQVRNAGKLR